MIDIFRPRHAPAQNIYDAFQREAELRRGRTIDDWIQAERNAVYHAAVEQAQKHNLRIPTMEDVVGAENQAMGHTDYGAQWAYRVVEKMRKPQT